MFGHRGAPATGLPENSYASFARALADGATALETDAHRTEDGVVVLSHDPVVRGVEIRAATLADVRAVDRGGGERVPVLTDFLARFPSVPVNIDIKQIEPAMEPDVVRAVGDHAPRVLLASFHVDALRRVRALGYAGPTGLARAEIRALLLFPRALLRLRGIRGARAQVPRGRGRLRFDTPAFVAKCHALGLRVDYWTVNDVDEARALLDLGADGIMSDAPATVRPAFITRGLRASP